MMLAHRALTACRQSYQIAQDGPVGGVVAVAPSPASDALGWLQPPEGVVAGLEGDDAAFVGVLPEGIVLCARGTTPEGNGPTAQAFTDWLQDFIAALMLGPGFPGMVHAGFYAAWLALWPRLGPLIGEAATAHPTLPFIVTGHSKGGALAFLFAWSLKRAYPERNVIARAFAPARVGDAVFAAAFNAEFDDAIRYEAALDIVPHVPPNIAFPPPVGLDPMPYVSAGRLAFIRADGSIVGDSFELHLERDAALLAAIAAGEIGAIAQAHSIDGPGGYLTGAYT